MALDIGAHRGILTKRLLERFEIVHAFEPTELAKQIDSRAIVHNVAVGRYPGYCSMQSGEENNGQTHVVVGQNVAVVTIDSLGLNPDFIKIDVEGYEFDVLRGARDTLEQYRPVLMIEENHLCQRYGHKEYEVSDFLLSMGYKRRQLHKWLHGAEWVYIW